MNTSLLKVVKEIVANNGETVLSEPKRVSAFLADLAREEPKPQKNALIKCLEQGFFKILKDVPESEHDNCKQKLALRLHDEEGLDLGLCEETLELLAVVLFGVPDIYSKWRLVRTFEGYKEYDRISAVAFSPDSEYIVTDSTSYLKLWEAESGYFVRDFEIYSSSIYSLAFSPDGKHIVSGSGDKTLKLWETRSGRPIRTFEGHEGPVKSVAFSPDGKHIVSASISSEWDIDDSTFKLWETESGQLIYTSKGHKGRIGAATFSPDGKYIVSGGGTYVTLWESPNGRIVRTFEGQEGDWECPIAFSPDGQYIVSGTQMKLWETESGQLVRTFEGREDSIISAAFSPDGKYIVSGSYYNKTMKLWETESGKLVRTFEGHEKEVSSVAFSPNGKYIISASGNSLKQWGL